MGNGVCCVLTGLSNVSSISTVEKVKLAFSLYDLDNSGSLEYAEVLQLLTAAHAGTGPISDSDVRTRVGYVCAYDKSSSFGDNFRAFR